MNYADTVEAPAYAIAKEFCHGDEAAADAIRKLVRGAITAERVECANTAVDWYEKETCGTLGADGLREAILNR